MLGFICCESAAGKTGKKHQHILPRLWVHKMALPGSGNLGSHELATIFPWAMGPWSRVDNCRSFFSGLPWCSFKNDGKKWFPKLPWQKGMRVAVGRFFCLRWKKSCILERVSKKTLKIACCEFFGQGSFLDQTCSWKRQLKILVFAE